MWDGLTSLIIEAIKAAFFAFIKWLLDMSFWFLGAILTAIPEGWLDKAAEAWSWLAPYVHLINYWFPLSEGLWILSGLWVFMCMYIAVKWTKTIIPFIGG